VLVLDLIGINDQKLGTLIRISLLAILVLIGLSIHGADAATSQTYRGLVGDGSAYQIEVPSHWNGLLGSAQTCARPTPSANIA
jgi:hypothetical protein